jgi:hypothetical protein
MHWIDNRWATKKSKSTGRQFFPFVELQPEGVLSKIYFRVFFIVEISAEGEIITLFGVHISRQVI